MTGVVVRAYPVKHHDPLGQKRAVVGRGESLAGHAPLLSFSFWPAALTALPVALAASAVFSSALSAPSLTFSPAFLAASRAASPALSILPLMVSAERVAAGMGPALHAPSNTLFTSSPPASGRLPGTSPARLATSSLRRACWSPGKAPSTDPALPSCEP